MRMVLVFSDKFRCHVTGALSASFFTYPGGVIKIPTPDGILIGWSAVDQTRAMQNGRQ